MARFQLQGPDGSSYEVDAPDAGSAVAALKKMAPAAPATPAAAPEDPIKAQVRQELAAQQAKGMPSDGISRQFLQGATFGLADEALAGLTTPLEMIKRRTWSPAEGYNYAKAREDVLLEDARNKGGIAGSAAELGGGLVTGGALAKGGLTLMKPGAGAMANIPRLAADSAIYGAITGAGEGSGVEERLKGAVTGGAVGAGTGLALGAAAPLAGAVGRNALGFIQAKANPEKFAAGQLARALSESGRTPQAIAQEVADAAAVGQPFTLADALGNPGQRMLSTVTRNPGAGRTQAVEFLDARQAGQGRRIANTLAEGLDAPATAQQQTAAWTRQRGAEADINYGNARQGAGAVDVSPAINIADRTLLPGATRFMNPHTNIADDSIESAIRKAKGYLTDGKSVLTDFDGVFRSKLEIDAMIEKAAPTVKRELIPIKNALDDALAMASPKYTQARDTFRHQSKAIDAIDEGRQAAMRGRTEDVAQRYGNMGQTEQAGFRVGYVDPLIEQAQGSAVGVNKARPFTSDALQTELPMMSRYQGPNLPGQGDIMAKRLARENTMFEIRAAATGGSKTADNLADSSSLGVSPEIVSNLLQGKLGSAVKNLVARSSDTLSGNTAQVRERLAKMLLQTTPDASKLGGQLSQIIHNKEARDRLVQMLLSGSTASAANVYGQRVK
jgi:hypothetical protein